MVLKAVGARVRSSLASPTLQDMLRKPLEKLRRAVSPSRRSQHKKSVSSSGSVNNVPLTQPAATQIQTPIQTPAINYHQVSVTITPAPAKIISTDPAFLKALQEYQKPLSDEELSAFKFASAESPQELIRTVQRMDEKHKSSSISRPIAPRVQKVLFGINQFMSAIKIFSSADPAISALVVGGMMVVMQLSIRFFEFFEKLADMMELLGQHLSYLSKYAVEAFQGSKDVQDALARAYGDLLDFYVQARRVFTDSDGKITRWTSFKLFLNLTWQPFEASFTSTQVKFMGHADIVVREAQAQGMIDEYSERERRKLREDMKDKKEKDEERYQILKWLSDVDFEDVHQKNFSKHLKGTGQWFLDDERFREWYNTPESGLLWCHGTAGTGKTILCSLVLERVSQKYALSSNTGIAFAYCNYKEPRKPEVYIAILIKQLSRTKEDLPVELEGLYKTHHANARHASYSSLQELFIAVAKRFDRVFVVLDALDECPEEQRAEFLMFLATIVSSKKGSGNVKLFVTSRKEKDIERAFTGVPTIQIEAKRVAADIESYIRFELARRLGDGTLKLGNNPKLKLEKKILDALLEKAEGMFLWVKLQLDDICSQKSDHAILEALRSLPENIEDTYNNIILKIDNKTRAEKNLAKKILTWVAYAKRPLSVRELAEAIATEPDVKSIDELNDRIATDYIDVCLNLVIIDSESSSSEPEDCYIKFPHYSVQEYLFAKSDIEDPSVAHTVLKYRIEAQSANQEIAETCLRHLALVNPRRWSTDFSFYAAPNFPYHVRALKSLDPRLWELIHNFISSGDRFYKIMKLFAKTTIPNDINFPASLIAIILDMPLVIDRLAEEDGEEDGEEGEEEMQTDSKKIHSGALHWAAQQSSCRGIEWLCAQGYNVNKADELNCTPLYYAAMTGEEEVVSLLLKKGADVSGRGGEYGNALQAAIANSRDLEVVQLLLDHGADVNTEGGYYGYPLQAAAYNANREIAQLLLDKGANVNMQGGEYRTALLAAIASRGGGLGVLQLLLDHGVDVNAEGGYYGHPLQAAAYSADKEIVQLLLEKGAKVNAQGGRYGTALQAAVSSSNSSLEVVQLLLDHGADVNAESGYYEYPLLAAVSQGSKEIVRLLLAKGAKLDIPGEKHGTILQAAIAKPRVDIELVKLLLDYGVDVNAEGGYYGYPLQAAAYNAKKEIVQLLLEKGAKVNAQGGKYGTALQAAVSSSSGSLEIVQLLLDQGKYGTTLEAADAEHGSLVLVQLLLDHGADINAKGGYYGYPLQAAAYQLRKATVQLLLDNGANVNAQGGIYGTAIQAAAATAAIPTKNSPLELVQLLLDNGADVNIEGGEYGYPLQAAVYRGEQEIVQLLLSKGAKADAQGGKYRNALGAAAEGRFVGERDMMKQLLLDHGAVEASGGSIGEASEDKD